MDSLLTLKKADERILNILTDGILIFEIDTNQILFANEYMCTALGYFQTDLIQFSLLDIHPIEDRTNNIHQYLKLRNNEITGLHYLPVISKNKNTLYFDVSIKKVIYKKKNCFLGTYRETTSVFEKKERINSLLKNLSDIKKSIDQSAIIAITDSKGVILEVNDKFCLLSKYPSIELIGQNHRILNSGVHPKIFFTEMWKCISLGNVWHGEICNKAKDGTLYWVDTTITPFLDSAGKPEQYISIRYDITSTKRFEKQLETAEKIAKIGSIECIFKGNKLFWSQEMYEILEFNPEKTKPSFEKLLSLVHPDDVEIVKMSHNNEKTNNFNDTIVFRLVMQNGTTKYIKRSGIAQFDSSGAPIRLLGAFQDITELHMSQLALSKLKDDLESLVKSRTEKLHEEKLERVNIEEQKKHVDSNYKMLFEQIPLGVFVFEYNQKLQSFFIKEINSSASKMENLNRNEITNKKIIDVYPNANQTGFIELIKTVYTTGRSIVTPPRYYQDKNFEGWREGFVYKLITNEVVMVFNNITEKIIAEQTLKKSLAEKEILLNEVHHRVKNNLQITIGLMQMQSAAFKDVPFINEFLLQSENRVKAMGLIHETICQTGQYSGINIVAYIKSLYAYLCNAIGKPQIDFKIETEVNEIAISNASAFGIVLNEIISNSLKYAFPNNAKGEIFVSILWENDQTILIAIKDNGIGVKTINENSKGLGVELIYGLIKQINGEVKMETYPSFCYSIKIPILKTVRN